MFKHTASLNPFTLGVNVEYVILSCLLMLFITILASANCGTHFGDTKLNICKKVSCLKRKLYKLKTTYP